MEVRKKVTINLRYRNAAAVIDAVQGDSARVVDLILMAGETPWEIPKGAEVLVQYCCPDGTGGTYDTLPDGRVAYEVTDGGVTLYLAPQVCAVPGDARIQLTILDGKVQVSTFELKVCVEPSVSADAESGEYTNLTQWWSQQGGGGLPTGGVAGQVLAVEDSGYAKWKTPNSQMVGLGNVDNTADRDKPVSTAQKAALDALSIDYIVEQGASGTWTYRKWKSGIAEMWGSYHNVTDFTGHATVTLPFEIVAWSMTAWVSGYQYNNETASNTYTVMYASPTTVGLDAWKHNSDEKSTKASCRIYAKCQWK